MYNIVCTKRKSSQLLISSSLLLFLQPLFMSSMETSQPLSIESFSYSWLVNLKPSLESLDSSFQASIDALDEASFIEMDPKMPPSKRFLVTSQFDFPISQSPLKVLHADELFSNGYVMPLLVDPVKVEAFNVSDSSSRLDNLSKEAPDVEKLRCSSLRRCRTLSKEVFGKYFRFLKPLYRRIRGHKMRGRVGDMENNAKGVKSWLYSDEMSPRISVAYSVDDCWRRSCDSDSSIYEAVLHCKKSIGQ